MDSDKIILSIIKDTGLSRREISEMVNKKMATLKGISIEEALLIITKDLAVNIRH
ncbi:MAG: DUF2240 family protein [Candidatus Hodarchaeota archaeon]